MHGIWFRRGVAVVLGILVLATQPASAQTSRRDLPDLEGVWFFDWVTPLERPPEASGPTLSKEELRPVGEAIEARLAANDPLQAVPGGKSFFRVNGDFRSSLLVDPSDGLLPYTDAGRERVGQIMAGRRASNADGPEARPPNDRCLIQTGAGPYVPFPAQNFLRIVQTPQDIVMHMELMSWTRVIPLAGQPQPIGSPQAHVSTLWEGDALVVRSTGLRGPFRGAGGNRSMFAVSSQTLMTERFERINEEEILYRFTIADPVLYARPWTAEMIFSRADQPMFENACHEGNYSLSNILQGARQQERHSRSAAAN